MLTFDDSARAQELAGRAERLMEEVVLPKERELKGGMAVSESTVNDLQQAAREYDIYAPQAPEEYGGMGVSFDDLLPVFEQAGRSLLGQIAMRVNAPDEGNMHLLELHGTELQKQEYLEPLVAGDIHSGFSMTEPMQGAGSDPKMIKTTAEKDGDEWVLDGHKWWTTNGLRADVLLVFARTDPDAHPYEGCSVFIVPADAEGVEIVRNIPHLGSELPGVGHAEIKYNGVRVPEEHMLGEEGKGFTHVQERLGPARLTHCMRFSGMAMRALKIAIVRTRKPFQDRQQGVQPGGRIARARANELHRIRILLLRHDRRRRGVRVGEFDVSSVRVDDEIFRQARQCHRERGDSSSRLKEEIACRSRIHRVLDEPAEPQERRRSFSVDVERRSREGRRTERRLVDTFKRIEQPSGVAGK